MMKITQVKFREPVAFGMGITTDFYDVTKQREFGAIVIVEKGAFLIITGIAGFQGAKRKRVPLSNVVEITEDEIEEPPAKPKEEPAPKGAIARPEVAAPPLPAARGLNAPEPRS